MITAVAVIITAIIVSLWGKYAYIKGNKNVYIAFEALNNELDHMARESGYESAYDYWTKKKSSGYADAAKSNLEKTLEFLKKG